MALLHYSVVQLVPYPTRGERLNVGVIVASDEPRNFLVRFLGRREEQRLRRISFAEDIGFIRDLERELKASSALSDEPQLTPEQTWSLEALRATSQDWAGTIQLTEPRAAIHDHPEVLIDALFREYVADPRPVKKRARDKRAVRQIIRVRLTNLLDEAPLGIDAKELLHTDAKVTGQLEEHEFDYRLGNGKVVHLVQALSLEKSDARNARARTELDAIAWSIDDYRKASSDVPISVVSIGSGKLVSVAEKVYGGLGAQFVAEEEITPWVNAVGARLIEAASEPGYD